MALNLNPIQRINEKYMPDTCQVTRRTGRGSFDPVTGKYADIYATIYIGKCRFWTEQEGTASDDAGQATILSVEKVSLPASAPEIKVEDIVVCTASVWNQDLINKKFEVTAWRADSYKAGLDLTLEHRTPVV